MKALVALFLLVWGSTLVVAQDWDGDQTSLPVPATARSRQTDVSLGLLAKTPVEKLKAFTSKDTWGTTVIAQQVKKGTREEVLWQFRWEPSGSWGPGTWVAFRDGNGTLRELRIILLEASDDAELAVAQSGTWVRLVPQGKSSRLDFFLAGRLVTGGWTVPASLLEITQSSDSWLWENTTVQVDWASVLPHRRWEDEKVEALRVRLHKLLSTVPVESSMLWWPDPRSSTLGTTENGSPWGSWMLLPGRTGEPRRGLGPWGVTLWTASGVLKGWKAEYPTWNALLEHRITLPGYSRALSPDDLTGDPAFALDWCRNLGLAVFKALHPTRPVTDDSSDVSGLPFLVSVPGAGYAVEDFPALAHQLAVTRPGQVYLATLSTQANVKGVSSEVTFRAPAVLLPWIGTDDRLRVAIYDGPREVSWAQWLAAVPQGRSGVRPDHLTLTALPLPTDVMLPLLPAR